MDNVTIIRIVAGIFCVVIAVIIIQRRRTRNL